MRKYRKVIRWRMSSWNCSIPIKNRWSSDEQNSQMRKSRCLESNYKYVWSDRVARDSNVAVSVREKIDAPSATSILVSCGHRTLPIAAICHRFVHSMHVCPVKGRRKNDRGARLEPGRAAGHGESHVTSRRRVHRGGVQPFDGFAANIRASRGEWASEPTSQPETANSRDSVCLVVAPCALDGARPRNFKINIAIPPRASASIRRADLESGFAARIPVTRSKYGHACV